MNAKTGLLLLVFFIIGGGVLYFYVNSDRDKVATYSPESGLGEDGEKARYTSPVTYPQKTDVSNEIVSHTLNDTLKSTSVNQKAQKLIREADLFIKEHNLTLPQKSNVFGMNHTVAAEFDEIDHMLDQMQNELDNSAGE